jgi:hypothetical protein
VCRTILQAPSGNPSITHSKSTNFAVKLVQAPWSGNVRFCDRRMKCSSKCRITADGNDDGKGCNGSCNDDGRGVDSQRVCASKVSHEHRRGSAGHTLRLCLLAIELPQGESDVATEAGDGFLDLVSPTHGVLGWTTGYGRLSLKPLSKRYPLINQGRLLATRLKQHISGLWSFISIRTYKLSILTCFRRNAK